MPETQKLEYKSIWKNEYLRWIYGFANAQGGKLIIGKDDEGKIVSVKNAKKLLENLPNKITTILGIVADVNLHKSEQGNDIESKATATRDLTDLINKQIIVSQESGKRDIHYILNQQ